MILNTEHLMEGLSDLLDSRLMYLDDQLEMAVMGYCYYHQFGDELPTYLYYDVYDIIGVTLEGTYCGYPEYSDEMAREEARKAVLSVVGKMVVAIRELQPQLDASILPMLINENDDAADVTIGGVAMVGGDMAVRIDYVYREYRSADVGNRNPE